MFGLAGLQPAHCVFARAICRLFSSTTTCFGATINRRIAGETLAPPGMPTGGSESRPTSHPRYRTPRNGFLRYMKKRRSNPVRSDRRRGWRWL